MAFTRLDPAAFWGWFVQVAPGVRSPADVDATFLAALDTHLRRQSRKLDFEIGVRPTTDEMELVITAGGSDRVAPLVETLVAAAPPVEGWRVTAFRPRSDVRGQAIRVKEEIVAEHDVGAQVTGDASQVVVTAWVRDLDRNTVDRMRAAHLLLEQALGERTLVERVAAVEWKSYAGSPPPGLVALPDLFAALPSD